MRERSLARLSADVPVLARTRSLSQAERDERGRAYSRAAEQARQEHRPVRLSDLAEPWAHMGGAAISLPFLSAGPSRAQRVRDSITYAENLRILQRLETRADSTRQVREAAAAIWP